MLEEHIAAFLYEQHLTEAQIEDPMKERLRVFEILAQVLRKELPKAYEDLEICMAKFREILREFNKPSDDLELLNYHKEEIKSFCELDQGLSSFEANQEALADELEALKLAQKCHAENKE